MTLEWFMFKEETLYRRAPSRHREVGRPPNTDFIVQSPLTPFLPLHISWPPSLNKHRVRTMIRHRNGLIPTHALRVSSVSLSLFWAD